MLHITYLCIRFCIWFSSPAALPPVQTYIDVCAAINALCLNEFIFSLVEQRAKWEFCFQSQPSRPLSHHAFPGRRYHRRPIQIQCAFVNSVCHAYSLCIWSQFHISRIDCLQLKSRHKIVTRRIVFLNYRSSFTNKAEPGDAVMKKKGRWFVISFYYKSSQLITHRAVMLRIVYYPYHNRTGRLRRTSKYSFFTIRFHIVHSFSSFVSMIIIYYLFLSIW